MTKSIKQECDANQIIKYNNKWNDDYKKQKYNFMSREDIIVFVKRILNKVI